MSSFLQRKRRLARAFERELGHDVYTRPHDAPSPHPIALSLRFDAAIPTPEKEPVR